MGPADVGILVHVAYDLLIELPEDQGQKMEDPPLIYLFIYELISFI